ncbi:MAG: Cellulose-binding domain protein [Myxococcales bacterium]|nr:Cellulose-binding domain protein [Myxococcales bacterium]
MTFAPSRSILRACSLVGLALAGFGCTGSIQRPGATGSTANGGTPGTTVGSGGAAGTAPIGVTPPVVGPCVAAAAFAPARLWRLNDQQYGNVVRDVFGAGITVPADVSEARSAGAEDLARAESLAIGNDTIAANYMSSAHATALSAVKALPALVGCATPDATCVTTFLETKVARAFRRPLTDGEVADMLALYQLAATDGPSEGVRVLMEYVLQAPAFLWRTELAGVDPTKAATAPQPLNPYELAGALGFLFLDSAPDDGLWAKAAAGTLTKPDVLGAEVDRLMALPAVKVNIANKVGSWLTIKKTEATVKDPTIFPEFTPAVKDALTSSAQLFLQDVVFTGKLGDLVTSRKMFLNKDLATLYGVPGVTSSTLVPVDVTLPERAGGILTQPAILAANSRVNRGDPIHRGLFIYSSLVCGNPVPAPPANATTLDQSLPATATERDRANFRASRGDCSACHVHFDPLGLLSERYDPIGRYREKDASGQVIDQSSTINLGSKVLDGPANGLPDLITRLQSSRDFADCAAGRLASVAVGRTVSTDNSCALQNVRDTFATSASFMGLFRAIATSPAFTTRGGAVQ